MTRLIDADALLKALKDNGTIYKDDFKNNEFIYFSDALDLITNATTVEADKCVSELTATIAELQATNHELSTSINILREDFRKIRSCYGDGYEVDNIARQALYKTPAQSLIQHDNEVIERCAKVCDDSWDGAELKIEILKLKGEIK